MATSRLAGFHAARGFGVVAALLLASLLAVPVPASSQAAVNLDAVTSRLEPEIRRAMVEGKIPSITIALVAGDEIVWSSGFGESNLQAGVPATPQTVYVIASTVKPMVAGALLQLQEEGHFELDDPVRGHLGGLRIQGENPENPVTFRHLLTHTSGLPSIFSPVPVWADTVPTPMGRYLEENLRVLGAPLTGIRYSNMGFTLLGRLVEEISGTEFREYMRARIFGPAGMTSTAFAPTPEMEERTAVPYAPSVDTGRPAPVSRIRFAEWPAGGVWGTVEDQARWLILNLNGGRIEGSQVLSERAVEASHTPQYDQFRSSMSGGWGDGTAVYGLSWWTMTHEGERYIAHSGSVRGYTAFVHANLDRRLGVALLSNGHRAHGHLVRLSFLATDLLGEHATVAGTR